jgi:16S rRNA (uracil1498-N3)-methyltransferase
MRVSRFFVNKPLGEETLTITENSVLHKIKNVLRLREGVVVIFFNGTNFLDYKYCIKEIQKDKIVFTLLESLSKVIEVQGGTILYLSLIKKDLFELAVLKATELGVSHIVPLVTERTTTHFLQKERLLTIVREGAEQCGRNTLPTLSTPVNLSQIVSSLDSFSVERRNTFALSLLGAPAVSHVREISQDEKLAFLIGPEGGWTEAEEEMFVRNRFSTISVSPLTLRAETAAIICTYLSSLFRK